MRVINHSYLKQVYQILTDSHICLSNKRLRRMAYFDVYLQQYTQNLLYNKYKKIVTNDASNNQTIVLITAIAIILTMVVIVYRLNI